MHSGPVAFSAAEVREFDPLFVAFARKTMTTRDIQTQLGSEKYERFKAYYKHTVAVEKAKRGLPSASSRPSAVPPSPAPSYSSSSSAPVAEQSVPVSSGSSESEKIRFTDEEKHLFSQVYAKLQAGSWDCAKAGRFFKGDKALISKFNQYIDCMNNSISLLALQREREALLAEQAALQTHKTFQIQRIQAAEADIAKASAEVAARIYSSSSKVKVVAK